ncbi:MAG TPA: TetR/AcrR family transcriptional regulator [Gaiellales bacterium]|jgi:AcrR family transcriptional regulator
MPKITAQDRAVRRQRIVDAAWRRLATNGYHETTVDEVCNEAGVSKGAFYGYFQTKQDLFLALLEEETDALNGVASELARMEISGAERVRRFVQAMLEVGDDPGRVQLRADLWSELAGDPVVRARFAETVERRRSVLRQWITRSIDAGDLGIDQRRANALASILIAMADGLMLHRALDPKGFRWPNIRAVLDALIAGIDRPSPT